MKRLVYLLPIITVSLWAAPPPFFVDDPAAHENFLTLGNDMSTHIHDGVGSSKPQDWVPATGATYDLGTTTVRWRNVYINGLLDIRSSAAPTGYIVNISSQSGTAGTIASITGRGVVGFPGQSFIEVYHSTAQVILNGVETVIHFDTEVRDAQSEYSTSAWNFTAKEAGGYAINAAVLFNTSGADYRLLMQIAVNGSNVGQTGQTCSVDTDCGGHVSKSLYLSASDVVTITVNQNSGANRTIHVGRANTWLSIAKVS